MKNAFARDLSGLSLGRYRLLAKIGSGGMGEVYRALDTALGREVAVKVLPPETVATPEHRRRFETEARSAATVSHPSLVAVFDVGESDGTPFIVQELVRGSTVGQLIEEQGALPLERVAEWGAQAADGLGKAHEAGILHRDVKPGNLMIGTDGRLRVLDFGLAKMLNTERPQLSSPGQTLEGIVVGTVHYMSPEQALGRELDPRSDAFSLAIVLYEMATGKRPFDGDSVIDTMHAIAYDEPRPLQAGDPPLSPGFLAILEKALEKKPEDRYQSVADLAVDLRRFLKRTSAASKLISPLAPQSETTVEVSTPSRKERRRIEVLILSVTLGVLLLGAGAWLLTSRRSPSAATPTGTRFVVQTDSREEGPVFSPDGRGFAYASNLRGDYDIYYRLLAGGSSVRLTDTREDERQPFFTPDGATLLFSRGDLAAGASSIWSVPTLGGAARRVLDSGDEPVVSPDGREILFRRWIGGRTSFWIAGIDGGAPRKLFAADHGELTGARFSGSGRWIAFYWRESYPNDLGDLWKIAVAGGTPIRLTTDRRDVWGHVAWLSDDSAILFSSARTGAANIWEVAAQGGMPRLAVTGSGWAVSPSLSPDGKSMLAQTQRNISDAWEYTLPDGQGHALTNAGAIWAPSRLPDGRLLLGDWTRQEEEIDLFIEDDRGARTFLAKGSNPRATADGKRVFFSTALGGGRRGLFTAELEGGPARNLTAPAVGVDEYPEASVDGSFLVFCRSLPDGSGGVMTLPLEASAKTPRLLYSGNAMTSRAGEEAAVFQSCTPDAGCGVYAVPYSGGSTRLLVREGRWPALSPDRKSVYALVGPKSNPALVTVPLAGGTPTKLFEFNTGKDLQFWAIFTMDVTADGKHLIVTHQRNDDDIVLFEGLFR